MSLAITSARQCTGEQSLQQILQKVPEDSFLSRLISCVRYKALGCASLPSAAYALKSFHQPQIDVIPHSHFPSDSAEASHRGLQDSPRKDDQWHDVPYGSALIPVSNGFTSFFEKILAKHGVSGYWLLLLDETSTCTLTCITDAERTFAHKTAPCTLGWKKSGIHTA